jgi:DNA-binding NtrC family response regulator
VVYFQNGGLTEAYGEDDRAWLEGYSTAAGRIFGFYFRKERQERELRELLAEAASNDDAPEILGDSAHTQALRRALHEIYIPSLEAESPEPILLLGERGTGKDLIARYLHAFSARRKRPLVVVNCAEITDELAASRFFGHKKGSFTNALSDEPGFFRAAHGGVLFLDEVAELSLRAQAHLLRVLENSRIVPVGQTREIPVDVAVLLATNRDLEEAVREGTLRADFYDRFRTLAIRLLPLRERPWDIPLLLEHFRRHHEGKHRKRTLGFTQEALRALVSYGWPGNVREVSRACSLFVIHARPGAQIDPALIESCYPEVLHGTPNPKAGPLLWDGVSMHDALRTFQRELILARLERHGGNVRAARESLGLTKTTFHRYMKDLEITAGGVVTED